MYTNRQSDQLATPGALGAYRPINIAATHPTNPTGKDLLLQRRSLMEAGVREFYQETNTFRKVLGMDGQFQMGVGWGDWNTAVNWGGHHGDEGAPEHEQQE